MAACLDYQSVYCQRQSAVVRWSLTLFAAVVLLLALSFRVWTKLEATQIGYDLARQRQEAVRYDMERRELELQLSLLKRPDRLSEQAARQLGLQSWNPQQVKKLSLP
jgi:hypothetical protein